MATHGPRCTGCSGAVSVSSTHRKLRNSKHVIQIFLEIVRKTYPDCSVSEAHLEDSYLCLPCFRRLESLKQLEQQLEDKRRKAARDLVRSASAGTVSLSGPTTPPYANVQALLQGRSRPSTPRRYSRRLDTPTRLAVRRLQPKKSPLVAVCLYSPSHFNIMCSYTCLYMQIVEKSQKAPTRVRYYSITEN